MNYENFDIKLKNGLFCWYKIFKCTNSTILTIKVTIKRCKESKYGICICKLKSEIIVDKKMKLIFQYIFKLVIDINYINLLVIK